MDVEIREAVPADAAAVAGLLLGGSLNPDAECVDQPGRYADAIEELGQGPGALLVAEVQGEVVGVCQLLIFRHLQHAGGRCAELESFHVAEAHRSQGIGAALLAEAERRAKAAGCYRVQLTSNLKRPDAHRFYEGHGYVGSHRGFKKLL